MPRATRSRSCYEAFKRTTRDILGAKEPCSNKTGELSVKVTDLRLLVKRSAAAEKFHGLADQAEYAALRGPIIIDMPCKEETRGVGSKHAARPNQSSVAAAARIREFMPGAAAFVRGNGVGVFFRPTQVVRFDADTTPNDGPMESPLIIAPFEQSPAAAASRTDVPDPLSEAQDYGKFSSRIPNAEV